MARVLVKQTGAEVGTVHTFAHGVSVPTAYLVCSGTAVSRTTYAALFAKIGITHGQGDGSTTFNLPDYRGRFLRGRANGAVLDPDRAARSTMASGANSGDNIGSIQTDDVRKHNHTWGQWHGVDNTISSGNGTFNGEPLSGENGTTTILAGSAGGMNISGHNDTGNENRPANANVDYYIKAI